MKSANINKEHDKELDCNVDTDKIREHRNSGLEARSTLENIPFNKRKSEKTLTNANSSRITIAEDAANPTGTLDDTVNTMDWWDQIAGVVGTPEGYWKGVIKLKHKHYRAISLLLQGYNQIETANAIGVCKQTMSKWMKPGTIFFEILSNRKYVLWEATQQKIRNLHSESIDQVFELIHSSDETIKLNAIKLILSIYSPRPPVDLGNLPYDCTRDHYEAQKRRSNQYHVDSRDNVTGERIRLALDEEDIQVRKYPEDLDGSHRSLTRPENKDITLSAKQLSLIASELHERNVDTEPFEQGIAIRNRDGRVVAELYPESRDRPSVVRLDEDHFELYSKHLESFFYDKNRPVHFEEPESRKQICIPQIDDISELSELIVNLSGISVAETSKVASELAK